MQLPLPDAEIISAQLVPAGAMAVPPRPGIPSSAHDIPAICRVQGRIEGDIEFEVWLPAERWNGKFLGVGNGGLSGWINYFLGEVPSLVTGVQRGYATASTDTGHQSGAFEGAWAMG